MLNLFATSIHIKNMRHVSSKLLLQWKLIIRITKGFSPEVHVETRGMFSA